MTHKLIPGTPEDVGEPLKGGGGETGRQASEVDADRIDDQAIIDSATAPTIPIRERDNNQVGHAARNPAAEQSLRPAVPVPTAGSYRLSLSLPNVAGGKPYEASIRACLKSPPIAGLEASRYRLTILSIDGLAETGLHHDIDGDFIRIHGTTTLAGDHRLRFFFRVGHPDLPSIDGHDDLTLTVNPDPRSLWKEIEPDPKLPFHKPHTASQRLLTPDASLVAASRRGRSHAHEGSFRDDDFALGYDKLSGWHYMVVADGAGSAKLSRRGSKVASEAVREPLLAHFSSSLGADFTAAVLRHGLDGDMASGQIIRTALYNSLGAVALVARKAVEGEAAANATKLRDYSTTFLLSVCRRFDVGWFAAAFTIGDGGVAIYSKNRGVTPLSRADSGEFAGQTRFLTMAEVWQDSNGINDRIDFTVTPDITALVAMTDGVSDPKFETDAKFAEANCWHAFWKELGTVGLEPGNEKAADELLDWLGFWSVGNHDDRTLAVLLPT